MFLTEFARRYFDRTHEILKKFAAFLICLVIGFCMCGNEMSMPMVAPRINHTASVIFLHGLGDTGHGWCEAMREISAPYVKYLCPTAPVLKVTLNGGMPMPAWFDIKSLNFGSAMDEEGIKKSAATLNDLIDKEVQAGIPSERIVIGGFSQGAAIAAYTTLTTQRKLGGAIVLSGFLPLHDKIKPTQINKDTPIFQGHGDADQVVEYKYGQMTHSVLQKFNSNSSFKTYPGLGHGSSDQEMKDVNEFLTKVLPMAQSL